MMTDTEQSVDVAVTPGKWTKLLSLSWLLLLPIGHYQFLWILRRCFNTVGDPALWSRLVAGTCFLCSLILLFGMAALLARFLQAFRMGHARICLAAIPLLSMLLFGVWNVANFQNLWFLFAIYPGVLIGGGLCLSERTETGGVFSAVMLGLTAVLCSFYSWRAWTVIYFE